MCQKYHGAPQLYVKVNLLYQKASPYGKLLDLFLDFLAILIYSPYNRHYYVYPCYITLAFYIFFLEIYSNFIQRGLQKLIENTLLIYIMLLIEYHKPLALPMLLTQVRVQQLLYTRSYIIKIQRLIVTQELKFSWPFKPDSGQEFIRHYETPRHIMGYAHGNLLQQPTIFYKGSPN